ncbi:MAG: glutathione-disulfide reductase [Pseudomonadales bacterium]|nr:glutathione-disulfide reductase [Pseudomonadales bacterium]
MKEYDYDLFVIGAGSGGVRASRISSQYGARVAVAEDAALGGTCVNVGCVPKKLFVYGSHFSEDFEDAAGFGWDVGESSFDWSRLRDNKTQEIERLNGIYAGLLSGAGVDLIQSRASVTGPHSVNAGGREYTAKYILIASGGQAHVPDIKGREHVITSNEAFYLDEFPRRVLVVGGGYIAVEFAGIFSGLGAQTTLAYRGPLFLRGFDSGVRAFVAEEIAKKNVELLFNYDVSEISKNDDGSLLVAFKAGNSIETDLVMYATGRVPNIEGLGLKEIGIDTQSNGAIVVNDHYQTSVPSIYAIGDVTDRIQLTPVAIAEAMCLADNLFRGGEKLLDYTNIPTAVFCQPNIGTVGLTEEQALAEFGDLDIYESTFKPMKHTLSGRDERSFMKLIVERSTDKVVGVHMVGPDAGEMMQGMGVALKCGATKADFDSTIGIHPTAAEEFVTMRELRK